MKFLFIFSFLLGNNNKNIVTFAIVWADSLLSVKAGI